MNAMQLREKARNIVRKSDRYPKQTPAEVRQNELKNDGTAVSTIKGLTADKFNKLQSAVNADPNYILTLHGFDPKLWEIVNCVNNYWNSQLKGGALQVSYQSKLTAKPKKQGITFEGIDEHFKSLDRTRFVPPVIKPIIGDYMAEVNIADLHLGKLCWHGDTPENYDHKIAGDTYYRIIGEIIHELQGKPIEYILFVWSNDFFNSDNEMQTTTGGTPQDTDIREKKLFNVGCEMLVRGIEMLSEIAPVKTFYTPSNHDEMTGYHALKFIEAWFRKDPNVSINTDAYPRKYELYGNTLLGFTHGVKENGSGGKDKASRLASLMPIEARNLWGQAVYHEMHTAHLHSEQMIQEINGVIVRRISSPTALDTYHTTYGYLGAVRKAQTFLYHKERGLIHTINTPV